MLCMLCLSAFLLGCATKQPTKVNSNLAPIHSLKTLSDMTQVAFEWPPLADPNIAGYYLYRSNPHDSEGGMQIVANIKDRFATHYVDTNLEPSTTYKYELRSYDANNNISAHGQVISVSTSKLIQSVSFAQVIGNLPGRAKIIWQPHSDTRVSSYIIERNDGDDDWDKVAEIKGRLNVEYIDAGLDPNKKYKYRIFVKTADGVVSAPSPIFSAQTKALPYFVKNLRATKNLPKKILISWDANQNEDFSHYVIYSGSTSIFLTKLATTKNTQFEDLINSNGSTRYYKVTAVDADSQESQKQQDAVSGSTLSAPLTPNLIGNFNGSNVDLSWSPDSRCVNYTIFRSGPGGTSSINVSGNQYNDEVSVAGEYSYRVVCVDEYGLDSDKSDEFTAEIK